MFIAIEEARTFFCCGCSEKVVKYRRIYRLATVKLNKPILKHAINPIISTNKPYLLDIIQCLNDIS